MRHDDARLIEYDKAPPPGTVAFQQLADSALAQGTASTSHQPSGARIQTVGRNLRNEEYIRTNGAQAATNAGFQASVTEIQTVGRNLRNPEYKGTGRPTPVTLNDRISSVTRGWHQAANPGMLSHQGSDALMER